MPPYTSGDELLAESRKNWQHYVEIASPVNATRLALRYINRLRLPGDIVDFDDFLTVAPQIPKDLPQIFANFFGKVVIVNEKIDAFAGVSQTFTGEVDETGVEVVLDIDVFTEGAYEVAADSIWDKFVQLRQFKNEIFFGFVTDKLLEAYQ